MAMTRDLTVRQKEELKELIKEANKKEWDETGRFMCRVRDCHGCGGSRKLLETSEEWTDTHTYTHAHTCTHTHTQRKKRELRNHKRS